MSNLTPDIGIEIAASLEEPRIDFRNLTRADSEEAFFEYAGWLSIRHAIDGAMPIPPTRNHYSEAYDLGMGPSAKVVHEAVGIGKLQAKLGFVMPSAIAHWTREQFIENGLWISHLLGSVDHPVMPRGPEVNEMSKLHLSPNTNNVKRVFGSMDNYQDELGFVSQTTLQRWTDQDWIDNGVWLSHMLGSPDEPVMPSEKDVNYASTLNVTPSINRIYERFGSLINYQKALGFEPKEQPLDYGSWTREQFIENGLWFSAAMQSADDPKMPTTEDVITGSKLGLCPPETAILKRFGRSILKYQDALGFVSRATQQRWTDQDWIDNGVWLSHMLGSPDEPVMPNKFHIEKASKHGIAPTLDSIQVRYPGGLMEYQRLIGFKNIQNYKSWAMRDYLRYGAQLSDTAKGRRPSSQIYDANEDGPSANSIINRFGSMANFHERLGFQDYEHFTEEQVLAFGITWLRDNDGRVPTKPEIQDLYRRGKSPSPWRIRTHFETFTNFWETAQSVLPVYNKIEDSLVVNRAYSRKLARHLLGDFKLDRGYVEGKREQMNHLFALQTSGCKIAKLVEMFQRSRSTIRWDVDDFIYFGQHVFNSSEIDLEEGTERLVTLDKAGLTPYLDELVEVFGSLEIFLKSIATQYELQADRPS